MLSNRATMEFNWPICASESSPVFEAILIISRRTDSSSDRSWSVFTNPTEENLRKLVSMLRFTSWTENKKGTLRKAWSKMQRGKKGNKKKKEAAAKIDGGKVKGKEDEGTANVILEKGRGNEKSRSRPQWHLACGRPGFASF